MTRHADILHLAPRELMENEPVTVSNALQIHVCGEQLADPTREQSMRIVEVSGSLDFWLDSAEDIYGPDDGNPV